jgi:ELWxxDGT repeat protein
MHEKLLARLLTAALTLSLASPAEAYWFKHCSNGDSWNTTTTMVADINPGAADAAHALFGFGARHELMAVYDGSVYFQADDGQAGAELWRTSGGSAVQVAELAPGPQGSSPHDFAVFQKQLYFAATTPGTGEELFRFDGSSASLAAETHPGAEGGEIFGLTVYAGALYFARATPNDDQQVWRFDGKSAQPVEAINAAPGWVEGSVLGQTVFVPFQGKLYYVRTTPLPEHYELWVYDGSDAVRLMALSPGDNITSYDFDLGVYQGALHFGVVAAAPTDQNPWLHRDELWRYTGSGSPAKIADLGTATSGSQPRYFRTYGGELYFAADGRLHRYDGSTVQNLSTAAPDLPIFPINLTHWAAIDRLFFGGFDAPLGREPFLFDGAGAHLLKDIGPTSPPPVDGSHPTFAAEADGLYFFADDGTHGRELWRSTAQQILTLDCDIVVAPIWDNWLRWPIDRRNVVVVTWWLGPEAEERLVSREAIQVQRGEPARLRVLEIDTRRSPAPEGFALVTVVFDRRTGERLDQGFGVVGTPDRRTRVRMERAAEELLNGRSLREAVRQRVDRAPGG